MWWQHDQQVGKCNGHIESSLGLCMHLQRHRRTSRDAHACAGQQDQSNHPLLRYGEICMTSRM